MAKTIQLFPIFIGLMKKFLNSIYRPIDFLDEESENYGPRATYIYNVIYK